MDLTLLEVSLDDAEITANAPFSGRESTRSGEADDSDASLEVETGRPDDAEERSGPPIGLAVGVLALLAVAALIRRRRSRNQAIEVA